MFFSISKHPQLNFPNQYQMGPLVVNTDLGWTQGTIGNATVVYKGYADEFDLSENLENIVLQSQPQHTGSFCVFVYQNQLLEIKTDRYRSFPIYIGDSITNLVPQDRTAWSDSIVTVHADLAVTESKFDAIGPIETAELTRPQVVSAIVDLLDKKTQAFLSHNTLPINVYLSGGVDSLLVYSFLQKHTDQYSMVDYSHVDYDYFWLKNSGDIRNHWGYKQIHHWKNPCVLTSGAPGDEFMLRSPTTGNMLLMHHNTNVFDLLEQTDYLHREYFLRDKHIKLFQHMLDTESPIQDQSLLFEQMCNVNLNDWQHWHIGHTLTWTPLRDLEIFKLLLRLPFTDQLDQFLNSAISREIIEHNLPGLSCAVSTKKNSGNVLENLANFSFYYTPKIT
jgi:hypothetical protein